jgi:DNA polymerase-1
MKQKIYIIDGYNFIYRLFFAVPSFTLKDGTPVNTVFWLAKMVLSWQEQDRPDKLIFVVDSKWKNHRRDIYEQYKATRDRMPTDLKAQENLIFELLEKFGINPISKMWFEADDIIWTLVEKLRTDKENDIYILSWDKDLYQFIDWNVAVYDTMKRKISHTREAQEKFWVDPKYIVDYLAICGDSSDNIPGITGFWPKKAQELINKFWSLEWIYENIESLTGKTKEVLENSKEIAFLSKQLATIDTGVDIGDFLLSDFDFTSKKLINEDSISFFKKLEFKSLIPKTHQEEVKDFSSLWVKIIKIEKENELENLKEKILKNKKISISTIWENSFSLNVISIFLWEKEVYEIDATRLYIKDFLSEILASDITIYWFEIKEDLKRIWWYTGERWVKTEATIKSQQSLF